MLWLCRQPFLILSSCANTIFRRLFQVLAVVTSRETPKEFLVSTNWKIRKTSLTCEITAFLNAPPLKIITSKLFHKYTSLLVSNVTLDRAVDSDAIYFRPHWRNGGAGPLRRAQKHEWNAAIHKKHGGDGRQRGLGASWLASWVTALCSQSATQERTWELCRGCSPATRSLHWVKSHSRVCRRRCRGCREGERKEREREICVVPVCFLTPTTKTSLHTVSLCTVFDYVRVRGRSGFFFSFLVAKLCYISGTVVVVHVVGC